MKLNKNNLFARYYEWIYGNLPNDVCSFFWGSVLAIGLFPILVTGRLLCGSYYEFGKVLGAGLLAWFIYSATVFLGLIMYAGFILDLDEKGFSFSEHYHLLGLSWYGLLFGMPLVLIGVVVGGFLVVATPLGIIWLIFKLFKVTVSTTPATVVIQNTKDVVGAVRGKYCTKITWNE